MESIHVDGVISNGQSNGVQAFGYDIYVDDIFVTRVDCLNGNSSNTEAVYFAGDRVSLGNITVENASNGQGGIAVKSSRTRQHGPIRYRTRLHPRMNCAMRIDGPDVELIIKPSASEHTRTISCTTAIFTWRAFTLMA